MDGPLSARGFRQESGDTVRVRSCVRPVGAAGRPLAQMGSAPEFPNGEAALASLRTSRVISGVGSTDCHLLFQPSCTLAPRMARIPFQKPFRALDQAATGASR